MKVPYSTPLEVFAPHGGALSARLHVGVDHGLRETRSGAERKTRRQTLPEERRGVKARNLRFHDFEVDPRLFDKPRHPRKERLRGAVADAPDELRADDGRILGMILGGFLEPGEEGRNSDAARHPDFVPGVVSRIRFKEGEREGAPGTFDRHRVARTDGRQGVGREVAQSLHGKEERAVGADRGDGKRMLFFTVGREEGEFARTHGKGDVSENDFARSAGQPAARRRRGAERLDAKERFLRAAVETRVLDAYMDRQCTVAQWDMSLSRLQADIVLQQTALSSGDVETFLQYDIDFHVIFYEDAGLERIGKVVQAHTGNEHRARLLNAKDTKENRDCIMAEHQAIMDAIRKKDKAEVKALLEVHLGRLTGQLDYLEMAYPDFFRK